MPNDEYWLDPDWDPVSCYDPEYEDHLADIYYAMKEEEECLTHFTN